MGLTVTANKLTVSHQGSTGTSIAFPDVCKTPTPAGPVPIPYPNVAMSSDTDSGSSTVKMDGKPIMLKGSNLKMSTGDEAGAAQGVVSSKIKGKAQFANYSFDIKVDGDNVCRLSDPTQSNMGSANTLAPFHLQAPLPPNVKQAKACEAIKEKQKEEKGESTNWGQSGIIPEHQPKIQKVVNARKVIIYFRKTNKDCEEWIRKKHKPKPHEVLEAQTISIAKNNAPIAQAWLELYFFTKPPNAGKGIDKGALLASNEEYSRKATDFAGVVMSLESAKKGEPLKGYGKSSRKEPYGDKWITGDYDLMDIMKVGDKCERPAQTGVSFARTKKRLNDAMEWDGIQHGPQAQWRATKKKDHVPGAFSIPTLLKKWLKSDPGTPVPTVKLAEGRDPLNACDDKLTVVAPDGLVIYLETHEDVKNALVCCGCAK